MGLECVHVNGRSSFDSGCVSGRVDIRGGEVYTYMSLVHLSSSANPCIATKVPSMLLLSDWHVFVCALRAVVCADAVALVAWLPLLSLQVFSHFHRLVCFNR